MFVIIVKPILPESNSSQEITIYNHEFLEYNRYIQEIRENIWYNLDESDLPESSIYRLSKLRAAEKTILRKAGYKSLTRESFLKLDLSLRENLVLGVIYQTALNILPMMAPSKVTASRLTCQIQFLEKQIKELFPNS